MGIAASQARYLSLLARQSDCEYQGQQIQQSILSLANKSSKLFAQMLDMKVPVPPSKTDYTSIVYEFSDDTTGTTYTIKKWQAITDDPDGNNYIVTYTSNAKEPESVQSFNSNPQVQFKSSDGSSLPYSERADQLQTAKDNMDGARNAYKNALTKYNNLVAAGKILTNYQSATPISDIQSCVKDGTNYIINQQEYTEDGVYALYETSDTGETRYMKDGVYYTRSGAGTEEDPYVYTPAEDPEGQEYTPTTQPIEFVNYDNLADKTVIDNAVTNLETNGALEAGYDKSRLYYNEEYGMAFAYDLEALVADPTKNLPLYKPDDIQTKTDEIAEALNESNTAKEAVDTAATIYYEENVPSYIGNIELTEIQTMTLEQSEAISKIISDMDELGTTTTLKNCFAANATEYDASTYERGLYTYEKNGTTYYVTFDDLATSYLSGETNQTRLPNYAIVEQISTKPKSTKAYMEMDASTGRFTSVRFADDAVTHQLTVKETSDEDAYEDAMQQYNYNMAMYDKAVADINAQTSIINSQDKTLEMKLSQLDIERTALKTEMEAVQKVLKDNVERSFKTFGN